MLPKSASFLYHQTRDKRGAKNPRARAVIVKDIILNKEYYFDTITEAARKKIF
jgi:hypothetical protein